MRKYLFLWALVLCGCSLDESEVVKQRLNSYVSAFNSKNPQEMSKFWATTAQYTNPLTGKTVQGQEQIAQELELVLQNRKNENLKVEITSVNFPQKDLALERGKATFSREGEPTQEILFQVVLVNEKGQWNITKIDEIESIQAPSHFEELKELNWLIGEWSDKNDTFDMDSVYEWDNNRNFINHHFKINVLGHSDLEGKQIIGWDPIKKRIRSWMFDSDGGYAQGKWKKVDNRWIIETTSTLSDGRKGSQTTTITPIDQNSYTLEISDREIDGEILPNVEPFKIMRKGA